MNASQRQKRQRSRALRNSASFDARPGGSTGGKPVRKGAVVCPVLSVALAKAWAILLMVTHLNRSSPVRKPRLAKIFGGLVTAQGL